MTQIFEDRINFMDTPFTKTSIEILIGSRQWNNTKLYILQSNENENTFGILDESYLISLNNENKYLKICEKRLLFNKLV